MAKNDMLLLAGVAIAGYFLVVKKGDPKIADDFDPDPSINGVSRNDLVRRFLLQYGYSWNDNPELRRKLLAMNVTRLLEYAKSQGIKLIPLSKNDLINRYVNLSNRDVSTKIAQNKFKNISPEGIWKTVLLDENIDLEKGVRIAPDSRAEDFTFSPNYG